MINAGEFSEGLASFMQNGKWGFLSQTDEIVIEPKYDYAHNFSGGLSSVELNGKHGFIDRAGSEVIALKYDFASIRFANGLALVSVKEIDFYIVEDGTEFYEAWK